MFFLILLYPAVLTECVCSSIINLAESSEINKCEDGNQYCPEDSTACIYNEDDFYCKCLPGFKYKAGRHPKTNKEACITMNTCEDGSHTCKKDSTVCVPKGDDYYCKCMDGYRLRDGIDRYGNKDACIKRNKCEDGSHTCPKDSTVCVPRGDEYYCKCMDGYQLRDGIDRYGNKDACIKMNGCEDGSHKCPKDSTVCVPRGDDYYCDCIPGFLLREGMDRYENKDACLKKCDCGEHSVECRWNNQGLKICKCFYGYAQKEGVCTATCRRDKDCLNGGICRYEGSGYFCNCKKHFKGDFCEINEVCESLNMTCNAIGAICTYFEWLGKGFCECPASKTYNRKLKMCEDICQPGSCIHGKCEVVGYHQKCRCEDGFEGFHCDKKILRESENLGFIILSGIACAACFFISVVTLIIVLQRLKKAKR